MKLTPELARRYMGRSGSTCGRPNAAGHPCGMQASYNGLPCIHHRTDEDLAVRLFIDEILRLNSEEDRRREERHKEYEAKRQAPALIGTGELTRDDAHQYFGRRRTCGRVGVYDLGEGPCGTKVLQFQAACRSHMTEAEKDAWLYADEAYELGRQVGLREPRHPERQWNSVEIKRRAKLKDPEAPCKVEEGGDKCNNFADPFSLGELCRSHMDTPERNAAELAAAAASREERRWWTPEKAESLRAEMHKRITRLRREAAREPSLETSE
jgi:hypothetical protein